MVNSEENRRALQHTLELADKCGISRKQLAERSGYTESALSYARTPGRHVSASFVEDVEKAFEDCAAPVRDALEEALPADIKLVVIEYSAAPSRQVNAELCSQVASIATSDLLKALRAKPYDSDLPEGVAAVLFKLDESLYILKADPSGNVSLLVHELRDLANRLETKYLPPGEPSPRIW